MIIFGWTLHAYIQTHALIQAEDIVHWLWTLKNNLYIVDKHGIIFPQRVHNTTTVGVPT